MAIITDTASARYVKTATIANGASLSDAIDLEGCRVAAIDMPSGWTTAALTFAVSNDEGGTYLPLYDDAGTEVTIASANVAASRSLLPGSALAIQLLAHRYLKLRSGTSASPTNQGAARSITLVLIPA